MVPRKLLPKNHMKQVVGFFISSNFSINYNGQVTLLMASCWWGGSRGRGVETGGPSKASLLGHALMRCFHKNLHVMLAAEEESGHLLFLTFFSQDTTLGQWGGLEGFLHSLIDTWITFYAGITMMMMRK